ncbi:MAG TPA: enoyl-CoA hydratase/isomerase family protein [Amycolatopsis sp.]|nr:enoyl-CoA hydratase/isomerase family protein [Amycolatopsis sp.]
MLLTERRDDVLHVTLNRPDSYNAVNPGLRDRLVEVFDGAEAAGVRAILLRGNGRGFCAGADLKASPTGQSGVDTMRTMRLSTQRLVKSFLDCPVPVVAAVHGVAAGIGLTLALAADICVAATDAKFTAAFAQRAIFPDGATVFLLPRLIGMARTKDFLMRGRSIEAGEALRIGMICETAPPQRLTAAAESAAAELAAMPTVTLSLTKQLLAQAFDLDLGGVLLAERAAQGLSATTEDAVEGRRSFAERRSARFAGR